MEQVTIGSWTLNVHEHTLELPTSVREEGRSIVERALSFFPREETWVQRNFRIPTLIARIDAALIDGRLAVFEVEERPCGIGVAVVLNPAFHDRFGETRRSWPEIEVVASPDRVGKIDDHIWTRVNGGGSGLVLLRCEPGEIEFHGFEPRSVSSLKEEGNKSYGLAMGLWRQVEAGDILPWDNGFVLKPLQGSKCKAVEVWDPRKRPGSSSKTRVERVLVEQGAMFLQNLVEPQIGTCGGFMMVRVYFAFDISAARWQYLGGVWMERKNLRIHGASDTITGVVS